MKSTANSVRIDTLTLLIRLLKIMYKWQIYKDILNKMLSYRRGTALQGALQFSPNVEDWNWETTFYGDYRSIFKHCDIIGRKI